MNPEEVSKYFPTVTKARSTINNIRQKNNTKGAKVIVKSTKDLQLSDDMNTIIIDGKASAFLRYGNKDLTDNQRKINNTILI